MAEGKGVRTEGEGWNEMAEEILRVAAKVYRVNPADLSLDCRFEGDLPNDSLAFVELIMAVESDIGVPLPDAEAAKIRTLGELAELAWKRKEDGRR